MDENSLPDDGFKPARFKIVGGCWHRDWLETQPEMTPQLRLRTVFEQMDRNRAFWEAEAKLEGFNSVEGWLAYYPKHGININDCWRVCAKRVQ
jgi:hypothetical protein